AVGPGGFEKSCRLTHLSFLFRRNGLERLVVQRSAIFVRHHLHKMLERLRPVGEERGRLGAASRELVPFEQDAQPLSVVTERMAHAAVMDICGALRRRSVTP